MQIEIQKFYPIEDKKRSTIGTMQIKLLDLELIVKGVKVVYEKGQLLFFLPSLYGWCDEKSKIVRYDVVEFVDVSKKKSLMQALKDQGSDFLLLNYAAHLKAAMLSTPKKNNVRQSHGTTA